MGLIEDVGNNTQSHNKSFGAVRGVPVNHLCESFGIIQDKKRFSSNMSQHGANGHPARSGNHLVSLCQRKICMIWKDSCIVLSGALCS